MYLEIHPGLASGGQVQVMIQERLKVNQALTRHHAAIPNGKRVRVVDLMDQGTLVVEPITATETEE